MSALRILCIEDDPSDRAMIHRILTREVVPTPAVETAGRLNEAIARVGQGAIDLALLDLALPDGEGLDLIQRLVAGAPGLPIVALSGTANPITALEAVAAGAQDYVSKHEVHLTGLLGRAVRFALDRQQMISGLEARARELAGELAESEAQLRQAQKMEALGRLAGGIAHDMNNILTVVFGHLSIARRRIDRGDECRDSIDLIGKAAEKGAALTTQLLAFSRKQVVRPGVVDPSEVVAGTVRMLGRVLGEDVRIVTRFSTDRGLVRVDRGQLEQALLNLAVNARDAMPDGGALTISVESAPRDVVLSIADDGQGMTPEVKAHCFEPFFTTKESGKGTGLGLATVYGVVEQSNGRIEVDSEPGRGTSFRITLPRVEPASPPAAAAALPKPPQRGTGTILLVEDEPEIRSLTSAILRERGYSVREAGSAEEALDLFAAPGGSSIDLLVTDVVLPGMSGLVLYERLSSSRPGLVCLCTTGYSERRIESREAENGRLHVLSKPFTPDALVRTVSAALGGH